MWETLTEAGSRYGITPFGTAALSTAAADDSPQRSQRAQRSMNNGPTKELTECIIGAAIDVHKALGPGLLESAYEACLAFELADRELQVERQKAIPVTYKGLEIDAGYRIDLLVEQSVVLEIKAVEKLMPIHEAQLISYLKLGNYQLGLLVNFNVRLLKQGIRRVAN